MQLSIIFVICAIVIIVTLVITIVIILKRSKSVKNSNVLVHSGKEQIIFVYKGEQLYYTYNPSIIYDENMFVKVSRISNNESCNLLGSSCKKLLFQDHAIEKNNDFLDKYITKHNSKYLSGVVIFNDANKKIELLDVKFKQKNGKQLNVGFEDPRLFLYKNDVWVIGVLIGIDSNYSQELIMFPIQNIDNAVIMKYAPRNRMEKNWLPFEYGKKLYAVYSVFPHKIIEINTTTGECSDAYMTQYHSPFGTHEIGGGSPPIQINHASTGKCFLVMAHTRGKRNGNITRKNFFYLFQSEPPFSIITVSPVFDLDNTGFNYIEFGTSLTVVGSTLYLAYGIEDCYGEILSYNIDNFISQVFGTRFGGHILNQE